MIEVTEAAVQAVADYFNTVGVKPIRVFLTQGCGGRQLALALDDSHASDSICIAGGFQFIMEKELPEQAQPVKIDYAGMEFRISSSLELGNGCRDCGSAGSCCEA